MVEDSTDECPTPCAEVNIALIDSECTRSVRGGRRLEAVLEGLSESARGVPRAVTFTEDGTGPVDRAGGEEEGETGRGTGSEVRAVSWVARDGTLLDVSTPLLIAEDVADSEEAGKPEEAGPTRLAESMALYISRASANDISVPPPPPPLPLPLPPPPSVLAPVLCVLWPDAMGEVLDPSDATGLAAEEKDG